MKNKQNTQSILMIEPVSFGFNEETANDNKFQSNDLSIDSKSIQRKALDQFTNMVEKLRKHGISVYVVKDTLEPYTPDSIFPNNWVSFHSNGAVAIYPMYAPNRREERREDILDYLEEQGFQINEITDYSQAEEEDVFLEGTGSMVLDRKNNIAYAAVSERTNEDLFIEYCEDFEFTPVVFHATQKIEGIEYPVYHTNVMMSVADNFAIICFDVIKDLKERKFVSDFLHTSQKEVIAITEEQMNHFAGNVLEVEAEDGTKYLIMSNTAYHSLNRGQLDVITKYCDILVVDISVIETYGGGSARCMMAEVFLEKDEI
ncbi:citrulline utilization hydrolase CtlX [Apibacter sp. HY039]|uniref:citrulline utilization hydrolase CtlX n=1 Tax=Apibacter sp. HY039 TaxID=2501476 RepID=UPI000FEC11FB|nr:arginine deiminase-related protein [Apibacter sp. HY039]